MSGYALLLPGQGSQHAGQLRELLGDGVAGPVVRQATEWTARHLDLDLDALDRPEALATTVPTQVSLVVAGVASARSAVAALGPPAAVAGHSVGGIAAAVVCGALELDEALRFAHRRATAMQERFPHGFALTAVVGLREEAVRRLLADLDVDEDRLWLANVNSLDEVVVAGADEALDRFEEAARTRPVRSLHRLAVAVPSHGPALRPVAALLAEHLPPGPDAPLPLAWGSASSARLIRRRAAARRALAASVAEPVRWRDLVSVVVEQGITAFVHAWPGSVLAGPIERCHRLPVTVWAPRSG